MSTESDDAAWARAHRACFQVGPLVEMRGKERLQVGFTVDLYAGPPHGQGARGRAKRRSFPPLGAPANDRRVLVPPEGGVARVEIEPRRAAGFLRPENEMEPEIGLRARVFHGDEYFKAVTGDERTRLSAVERNLTSMGLRPGHW